ncbi:MAG: cupin domain-containing protein [Halobacteriales archaeon]
MSYGTANYHDVEPAAGALYFLRDPLECETVGVTVLEPEPGWTGMEHDHAEEDHEEVYLLLEGAATVIIEGEAVELEPGDAVRVPAGATRRIENGDAESRLVLAGAP